MSSIPISIRVPSGLRERVRESAETNRRSMNSEIVFLLEQALPDKGVKASLAKHSGNQAE